jgi:N-acetylneuraminate lyase
MATLHGLWPALVTPLNSEGRVAVSAAEQLIESLLGAGVSGLYVCGGTGEGVLLSPAIRQEMAETAIRIVAGRVPVMVHVGAITTAEAVALARHAGRAGATALSAIPPFYYSYPFSAILEHYRALAAAATVPLYIYYIPGSTGNPLSAEQILEICAIDGIAGLKYTAHDLYTLSRLLALRDPSRVNVLSGPDELFLPCQALGCEGAVGTTYNFMPRLYIDLLGALHHGDLATAQRLQFTANALIAALLPHGVIAATKTLLGFLGYDVGHGVPPLPRLEGEEAAGLRARLEEAGLFRLLERPALYGPAGDPLRGRLA